MKLSELLGNVDLKEKFVLQKFLCVFLDCSREELWTGMDEDVSEDIIQKTLAAYKSYVDDKRPLEYILGHVDFFGNEFFVNESTLIPRPETEYMITAVTEYISGEGLVASDESKKNEEQEGRIRMKNLLLDIGTGCGVLGISVLLQNPDYFSEAIFTDFFYDALNVAKTNYQAMILNQGKEQNKQGRLETFFLQSDLLDFLVQGTSELPDGNTILVANLPYIPEETFEANVADNVKKREPKPAFVGGEDGLDYYRKMFDQLLSLQPKNLTMFLEMMTWQVDILREAFGDRMEFEEVKTFHFNIRIVKARIK